MKIMHESSCPTSQPQKYYLEKKEVNLAAWWGIFWNKALRRIYSGLARQDIMVI